MFAGFVGTKRPTDCSATESAVMDRHVRSGSSHEWSIRLGSVSSFSFSKKLGARIEWYPKELRILMDVILSAVLGIVASLNQIH